MIGRVSEKTTAGGLTLEPVSHSRTRNEECSPSTCSDKSDWNESVSEAQAASALSYHTRREMLQGGAKLAWIVPAVITLSAPTTVLAASAVSGDPSCAQAGELCDTDSDCCGGDCDSGICE